MRRVSIAGLLGFIAVFAFGLAALVNATNVWVGLIYTLMIGHLFTGLLGVILQGRRGGAWIGCTLFGWGYLLLCYVPELGEDRDFSISHQVLSDTVSEWVFKKSNPEPPMLGPGPVSSNPLADWAGRSGNSARIGHFLFVILFAQTGAILGYYLSRPRESVNPSTTTPALLVGSTPAATGGTGP